VFTQVVQMARRAGLGKLGHVAIDSTRVRANASRRSTVDWDQARRQQWAQDRRLVRKFQQKASAQDAEEDGGVSLSAEQQQALERQAVPALPKKGRQQVSLTDPDSRFLRTAQGWELGYTADLAVSDDHLIVAARVTQNATDNGSLVPMVEEVERQSQPSHAAESTDALAPAHPSRSAAANRLGPDRRQKISTCPFFAYFFLEIKPLLRHRLRRDARQ